MSKSLTERRAIAVSRSIYDAFLRYDANFRRITRRAAQRFHARDDAGLRADLIERMELWDKSIVRCSDAVRRELAQFATERRVWHWMKEYYGYRINEFRFAEFARTFFTSVSRRTLQTRGTDALVEFVLDLDPVVVPASDPPVRPVTRGLPTRVCLNWSDLPGLCRELLEGIDLRVGFDDLESDALVLQREIERVPWREYRGPQTIHRIELLEVPFFQSNLAHIVGMIEGEGWRAPLAIAIRRTRTGLELASVAATEDDVAMVFGFTRDYFLADVDDEAQIVQFLAQLLPGKPIDELYTVMGRSRQGKTERYRTLASHLRRAPERFVYAAGDVGMVMIVFTHPSHHLVFKVIRDRFGTSKQVTREQVHEKYKLVSYHDRSGRLIDVQAYRNLEFPKRYFEPDLLEELITGARLSVRERRDSILFDNIYMERKLRPLNLYLREANRTRAERAVIDYGQAIKDLANANIFPGDMLLKNFGVTRHGRVIFYDYDEVRLMTECTFRKLPRARSDEDEYLAETWFEVADGDVFPEQFECFLGMSESMRETFMHHHADLVTPQFWRQAQARFFGVNDPRARRASLKATAV